MNLGDLIPLAEGSSGAIVLLLVFVTMLFFKKIRWGHEYDDLKTEMNTRIDQALEANKKLEAANDTLVASLQSERDQKAQLMSNGSLINQLFTLLVAREKRGGGDISTSANATEEAV